MTPASATQLLILDSEQIAQKINRIAYQILEDSLEEKEIILAGMGPRGFIFARRLEAVLRKIADFRITPYQVILNPKTMQREVTADIDAQLRNKVIILVDDVLNSGRTLAYGFSSFLNVPHKKIRTAVLVDRSHKTFPIATDFVGLQLATVLKEHVEVIMDLDGANDRVILS